MRTLALLTLALFAGCASTDNATAICELFIECDPEADMTVDECLAFSDEAEEPTVCVQEYNNLTDCIADLSNCSEYDAYWAGVPGETGYPCAAEDDAFYSCEG